MESPDILITRALPFVAAAIAFGYWAGWLFRDISFWKVVAWFVILPYPLDIMAAFNQLWMTIPFAIAAIIGFHGVEHIRSQYHRFERWRR
ncbi:hypothetical protein [Thalassotalea agarivorans]|uniref:Uncharacterized protein n=1 Tax=Thalassotalea agarivorans TaxID=349064 RepID=A0A1I0GME3_THASX|nr:hypothetical protein [Thalassotalea agarivorans]SET71278.1 hypothetical protein SAMN05660429_02472 [Thalassotalea agarivorans]